MSSIRKMFVAGALTALVATVPAYAAPVMTFQASTVTAEAGAITFNDFDGTNITAIASVSGGVSNAGTNPGGGGNWLSVTGQASTIIVAFTGLVDYFGFLWGTQDAINTVQLFNGATLVGTYAPGAAGGAFANFHANSAADLFDRVVMSNNTCCFETDNYAARLVNQVPAPTALGLFGLGLAGLGLAVRRRPTR